MPRHARSKSPRPVGPPRRPEDVRDCRMCLQPASEKDGPVFKVCACEDPVHRHCLDQWRFRSGQFEACSTCKGKYTHVVRTDLSLAAVAWEQVPRWTEAKAGLISAVKTDLAPLLRVYVVMMVQLYGISWLMGFPRDWDSLSQYMMLMSAVVGYGVVTHIVMTTQAQQNPERFVHTMAYFWEATPLMLLIISVSESVRFVHALAVKPVVSLARRIYFERMDVEGTPVF